MSLTRAVHRAEHWTQRVNRQIGELKNFLTVKELVFEFEKFRTVEKYEGVSAFESSRVVPTSDKQSSSSAGYGGGGDPSGDPDDDFEDFEDSDDDPDEPDDPESPDTEIYYKLPSMKSMVVYVRRYFYNDRTARFNVNPLWPLKSLAVMVVGKWAISTNHQRFINNRGDGLTMGLSFIQNGLQDGETIVLHLSLIAGASKRVRAEEPYEPTTTRELKQIVDETMDTLAGFQNPPEVVSEVMEKVNFILNEVANHPKQVASRMMCQLDGAKKSSIASGVLSSSTRPFAKSKFVGEQSLPDIYKKIDALSRQEKLCATALTRAVQLALASEYGQGDNCQIGWTSIVNALIQQVANPPQMAENASGGGCALM